jgi:predicted DsbA family dithiol-disulfide isomerase
VAAVSEVHLVYYTDPGDPWSWAMETARRRLQLELGERLRVEYRMGGFAREVEDPAAMAALWEQAAARSGARVDATLWSEAPPASTYPACLAVKAAGDQGDELAARYLRRLREGFAYRIRKLDTTEALVEEAREAGLDAKRFRIDLASNATVEAFGADLEHMRARGLGVPALVFSGEGGERTVSGYADYETLRDAASAASASR